MNDFLVIIYVHITGCLIITLSVTDEFTLNMVKVFWDKDNV